MSSIRKTLRPYEEAVLTMEPEQFGGYCDDFGIPFVIDNSYYIF